MKYGLAGALLAVCGVLSACDSSSDQSPGNGATAAPTSVPSPERRSPTPKPSPTPSTTPTSNPTPAPTPTPTPTTPTALIFNGAGTSLSDYQSLLAILQSHGVTTQTVDSAGLEAMSAAQLASFKLIVWPGGDSITQNDGLNANTRERVREAVVNSGVNFAGFCAGAFIAVGPTPAVGGTPAWGLSIADYGYVTVYYPNGPNGVFPTAAMVEVSFPNGTQRDLVWWDGPFLPNVPSGVVAKYPDGTAAMVELQSGKGFVVLTGIHPEAPQSWRTEENLVDTDGLDLDIAWNILNAALTPSKLATY